MSGRLLAVAALIAFGVCAPTLSAAAAPPATPSIDWAPCADAPQVDCGTMAVPLDYAHPKAATVTLALERRKADDPAHKIGSLFVNPGGPGTSGRHEARNAAQLFSADVLAHFDVIGFDPRGVSASTGVQCFPTNADAIAVIVRVTDVPISDAEQSDTLSAYRDYTSACGDNAGPLIEHMSTLNVARDLDLMRQAVGDATLSYAGYSYGGLIGDTYANLFPNRVRAILLDGPMDADQLTNHRIANKLDRAGGFETVLSAMLSACQSAGTACPFFGGDLTPRQKFDQLRERLRTGPLAFGSGEVSISSFTDGVSDALLRVTSLAPLAAQLQQLYDAAFGPATAARAAATVAPSPLAQGPAVTPSATEAYRFNVIDSWLSVICVDAPIPHDQSRYPGFADSFESIYRTFGRWELYRDAECASWPIETKDRYAGPWNRMTSTPVLIIAQTLDPAAPYAGAARLAFELGNARLLTVDGFGHTSQHSACAAAARNTYLLTQQLPAPDARCAQDTAPFP